MIIHYCNRADHFFTSRQIEENHESVEEIEAEDRYVIAKDIILLDVREPEEFTSGHIEAVSCFLLFFV
ncbi:MAG: rhodanese-like domain-containing protein [Sulfurimonadaceae bacterium]